MKIVVLSNNPIGNNNSNGRTLCKMFNCFKNDEILNIFFSGNLYDEKGANYYKISERRILKNQKPYGTILDKSTCLKSNEKNKIKKTAFKCLLRSIVWSKRSVCLEIENVVRKFEPSLILIQCGDSDFLINISVNLSKKLSIPLISFNSEDYVFKKWDYFKKTKRSGLLFKLFMSNLRKSYKSLYSFGSAFIYLNESLQKLYDDKFGSKNSFVIYNSTDVVFDSTIARNNSIVYSGNLGVGRDKTLIDLSKLIFELFGESIKVYSQTTDNEIVSRMKNEKSIDFIGPVDYLENLKIICSARLLILVDSFDDFYDKDTKNAFSTKIADSLASGTPLLILSPKGSATYEYFSKNNCSFLCSTLDEARNMLLKMCAPNFNIYFYQQKQLLVAKNNHSSFLNSKKFYNIVLEVCENDI